MSDKNRKAVCHFSCGATSAIATAIAIKNYDCELIYSDTGSEHPDNMRFLKDCEEKLFKKQVKIVKSKNYNNIFDVFEKKSFLASPAGAPCTTEMKKLPIRDYLGTRLLTEIQVFGFDASETTRIARYKANNPEVELYNPLHELGLTKANCLALLVRFDIELPAMYKLGYSNANCIGCVKAENLKYWAAIRKDFPETFDWYAKFERKIGRKDEDGKPIGAAINKKYIKGVRNRLFLDELPMDIKPNRKTDMQCGYSCGSVGDFIEREDIKDLPDNSIDDVMSWLTE